MPYIYKITNSINQKCYIGKTLRTVEERWKEHCKEYKRQRVEKRPLYNAMKKYGLDCFNVEIVEECSEEELGKREQYWIETYGTYRNGYNATYGGDGKPYIDRRAVCDLYSKYKKMKTVAKIMGLGRDTVSTILKENNIEIVTHYDCGNNKPRKPVVMKDKETDTVIRYFNSCAEAARWLVENKKSKSLLSGLRGHISSVCAGKRQTVAGYKWEYVYQN